MYPKIVAGSVAQAEAQAERKKESLCVCVKVRDRGGLMEIRETREESAEITRTAVPQEIAEGKHAERKE